MAHALRVEEYAAAVNALNTLGESPDVKPVRFIALAAIGRNIVPVFPEAGSEKPLHKRLARFVQVKDRFSKSPLEDVNVFEIGTPCLTRGATVHAALNWAPLG